MLGSQSRDPLAGLRVRRNDRRVGLCRLERCVGGPRNEKVILELCLPGWRYDEVWQQANSSAWDRCGRTPWSLPTRAGLRARRSSHAARHVSASHSARRTVRSCLNRSPHEPAHAPRRSRPRRALRRGLAHRWRAHIAAIPPRSAIPGQPAHRVKIPHLAAPMLNPRKTAIPTTAKASTPRRPLSCHHPLHP